MPKKILFVSHEASRTGAPKVLLFFLRWLKANTDFQLFILFKRGGELLGEFEALGKILIWPSEVINHTLLTKGLAKIGIPIEAWCIKQLSARLRNYHFDLIYVNSITCSDIVVSIKKSGARSPVVCHVHELRIIIDLLAPDLPEAKKYIDRYIAVSEATKRNLVDREAIAEDRIAVVYEFIPVREAQLIKSPSSVVRDGLGIPPGSFVIGGSGFVHWRKGYDLLINVARIIDRLKPGNNFFYVWVGSISDEDRLFVEEDLKKANLHQKVKFTGATTHPQDYFQTYDVFALPSREDPFPLVCLEAIALGKPIVCFERAGGIPELVAQGCGISVPYLDTLAMAHQLIKLSENPDVLAALSQKAREVSHLYNADQACHKLYGIVSDILTL